MSLVGFGIEKDETFQRLCALPHATVLRDIPLARYTRFGLGGLADLFVETGHTNDFIEALRIARLSGLPFVVIGGGTNLIVADAGFRGIVLRLVNREIRASGENVYVESGAVLQDLVDFTVDRGLKGLETMTGIPGFTGAAIYGNAGAYGHSISERVSRVRFFDGEAIREIGNAACEFHYRESVFKRNKSWIVLSADLTMEAADARALREQADKILEIRNKKYPPTMKCAGSIFKNFLAAELPAAVLRQIPEKVVIEGKVPSAWFLEQVGAMGIRRGDIQVADYHANLIYNDGVGSSDDLLAIVTELKDRVAQQWGIPLEEEVQYVGFAAESVTI
jgi:UDP-N-acetylmuramate dehydrogenase